MRKARVCKAGPDDVGRRLDRVLRKFLPDLALSAVFKALRGKRITVNGKKAEHSQRIREGDELEIDESLLSSLGGGMQLASLGRDDDPRGEKAASALESLLVYGTDDLLFLNKPKGMPSHGPGGLDRLVKAASSARQGASLSFEAGPLHRLDRNTSGLITFPRTLAGAQEFTALLRVRGIRKKYLALLCGRLAGHVSWMDCLYRDEDSGVTRIAAFGTNEASDSREARSLAIGLLTGSSCTLAMVEIETGLTHQIRAQAAFHGHPLVGDTKYGAQRDPDGYLLHAWRLEFPGLRPPAVPEALEAGLPEECKDRLGAIFGASAVSAALHEVRLGHPAEKP